MSFKGKSVFEDGFFKANSGVCQRDHTEELKRIPPGTQYIPLCQYKGIGLLFQTLSIEDDSGNVINFENKSGQIRQGVTHFTGNGIFLWHVVVEFDGVQNDEFVLMFINRLARLIKKEDPQIIKVVSMSLESGRQFINISGGPDAMSKVLNHAEHMKSVMRRNNSYLPEMFMSDNLAQQARYKIRSGATSSIVRPWMKKDVYELRDPHAAAMDGDEFLGGHRRKRNKTGKTKMGKKRISRKQTLRKRRLR